MFNLFDAPLEADMGLAIHAAGLVAGGLARGFSGFGAALIIVPITSAVYGPGVGVPLLTLVDSVLTLPFVIAALRKCVWREVLPIGAAAIVGVPLGVLVLTASDPVILRWVLCLLIGVFVALLASGWRYQGTVSSIGLLGVGGVSGFSSGSTGIGGPPLILFWLGGRGSAATIRANIFVFFAMVSVSGFASFGSAGLFTRDLLALVIVSVPIYGTALWIGSRLFSEEREQVYRRLALLFCALAAIVGLPLFDGALS